MYRGRRLRMTPALRSLVKETRLDVHDLIFPIFVVEGTGIKKEIASLPGMYHYSVDRLNDIVEEMEKLHVMNCLLFGIPAHKDACGSEAYREDGVIQQAIRKIKKLCPEMVVIADVCMCEYTDHGHCGILDAAGNVQNDETLLYLQKIACSYAKAGVVIW